MNPWAAADEVTGREQSEKRPRKELRPHGEIRELLNSFKPLGWKRS